VEDTVEDTTRIVRKRSAAGTEGTVDTAEMAGLAGKADTEECAA
jgi:hypothetical protein